MDAWPRACFRADVRKELLVLNLGRTLHLEMALILSTLPHYLSALPLLPFYNDITYEYVRVIIIASTLSVLYHFTNESFIVAVPDYTAAFIWLLYDLYFSYCYGNAQNVKKVIAVNSIVLVLNWSIPKSNPQYEMLHSVWHLASAAKCYYVSLLVSRLITTYTAARGTATAK
jgi:hypothetical protein